MINKYRYVEYTDDGCSIYECLSCHAKWEVRSFPDKFCGNCGIAFTKLVCLAHDERLYYCRGIEIPSERIHRPKDPEKYWVIQEKLLWHEEDLAGWRDQYRVPFYADDPDRGGFQRVKAGLNYLRQKDLENVKDIESRRKEYDEDWDYKAPRYEYRAVVKPASETKWLSLW